MTRSAYEDCDDDPLVLGRWRGQLASAIRGKRGQAFLRDLVIALDAMPEKRLIANELDCADGVCALGSVGRKRGLDMSALDPVDGRTIAQMLDVAEPLVREIEYMNDEYNHFITPEERWSFMRTWAESLIKEPTQ